MNAAVFVEVAGERRRKFSLVEKQKAVLGRQDRRHRRAGRRIGDQGVDRLAFVGGEGGDVDQPATFEWVPASVMTAPP